MTNKEIHRVSLSLWAQDTTLLSGHDLLPPFFGLRGRANRALRVPNQRKNVNCRVVSSLWERAGVREIQSVDPDGNNAKGREFAELEVPWLPARGTHWQLSPVKRHFEVLLGKMLQPEKRSPKDVEVPYLKAQHIQWDKVVTQDLPTMWATPEEVSSLRPRTAKLDELITVAECAIHLTQERRTSLIAAAVTGQIRVG